MKDHQIAQLVNQLRDTAIAYHASGQLRERISTLVNDALKQTPASEPAATVIKKGADRQWMSERLGHLPDGIYSLYLAPCALSQRGGSTLMTILTLVVLGLLFAGMGGR
jgi:hypothetical protein